MPQKKPDARARAPEIDTSSPAAKTVSLRAHYEHVAATTPPKHEAGKITGFVKLGEGEDSVLVGDPGGKATLLSVEDAGRYALQPVRHLPADDGDGPPRVGDESCQEWDLDAGTFWICHHSRFGWVVADVIEGEN